jgi:hypothetical protein
MKNNTQKILKTNSNFIECSLYNSHKVLELS